MSLTALQFTFVKGDAWREGFDYLYPASDSRPSWSVSY